MKKFKFKSIISALLLFVLCLLVSCGEQPSNTEPSSQEKVDYVSSVKLTEDFTGKTISKDGIEEVKLYAAVDGDTIHVTGKGGIYKLRFLGVDTPESTAQIEPWGFAASNFTKNIVKNANSIVIASDDMKNAPGAHDTYDRYLVWVWYQAKEGDDYRLLNLELVQEGYSISKNSGILNYKQELTSAATQARNLKLFVWSDEKDPDYCYDAATEVSLPLLKESIARKGKESKYYAKVVVFTALIAMKDGDSFYLNDTVLDDEVIEDETEGDYTLTAGTTYGIQVYHRSPTSKFKVGNIVKVSGTLTYYETGDVYQLTDVKDLLISSDENNLKVIEKNVEIKPQEITVDMIDDNDHTLSYRVVSLKNLDVTGLYTTVTVGSSSYGAITITCSVDGKTTTVRTSVLYDKTGTYDVDGANRVLESNFEGATIDVVGVLEKYNGKYQVKLVSMDNVVIR